MVVDLDLYEDVFLALSKPRAGNEGAIPKSIEVFMEKINDLIFDFLWKTREVHRGSGRGVSLGAVLKSRVPPDLGRTWGWGQGWKREGN